jgi:hypothetical protein
MTTHNFCFYMQIRLIQTSQVNGRVILPPLVFPGGMLSVGVLYACKGAYTLFTVHRERERERKREREREIKTEREGRRQRERGREPEREKERERKRERK